MARIDARCRCLREASILFRARQRRRTAESAFVRRSENISALSQPHDDGQDVDGGESRSACAVSESRDDRDGGAYAAAFEAAWAEAEVRAQASTRARAAE